MNQQQLIVRWVKASERLPQNNGEYLCRYVHPEASCYRGAAYLLYSDGQFYAEDEMANLEWLEEGGMQGEGERLRLKQELDEPDSIEALVVDYITMLELDALGELKEDGTLQDKGVSHVFSCLRRAKERSQERPFVLLADILRKRIYEPKPQTEQP